VFDDVTQSARFNCAQYFGEVSVQLTVLNDDDAKLIAWYVESAFPDSNEAAKAFFKNELVEAVPTVTVMTVVELPAEL